MDTFQHETMKYLVSNCLPEQSPYSPYGTNDLLRESSHPRYLYFLHPISEFNHVETIMFSVNGMHSLLIFLFFI